MLQRKARRGSVPSWRFSKGSLLSTLIIKFAHNSLLEILVWLIHLQDSVSLKNKVAVLRSHITSLNALFVTRPDDVAELRRRDKLIQYATTKPFINWS